MKALINIDQTERLGATDDWREILAHPYFESVNTEDYLKKTIQPPFKPKFDERPLEDFFDVKKSEDDLMDTQIGTYAKAAVLK